MSIKYSVVVEKFAERHYIKTFAKKYGRARDITFEALVREFQSFDVLFERNISGTIVVAADIKICKTEFKVAGKPESRHRSGNRCIVAINEVKGTVNVLLVYSKTDIGGGKETATRKILFAPIIRNIGIYFNF